MKAAVLLLALLFLSSPAYGGPRVYTEQDLERYKEQSTYDEETVKHRESELKQWEIEKRTEEEIVREQRAREERELAQQRAAKEMREIAKEADHDNAPAPKKKKRA